MERILCQYSSNKSSVLQINTICFARKTRLSNKCKVICKYKTLFERRCRGMDKYMYCVLQLRDPFAFLWGNLAWFSYKCMLADFLTNVCRLIFSHVCGLIFSQMQVGRFSHKCVLADFLTNACWQIFSQIHVGRFSHKCVLADFLTRVWADFLTNACWQIF